MIRLLDRCKQETTATGTGNLTLGSTPSGYRALTSVYAASERFFYVVEGQGTSEWEIGYGYLSASDLVREQPLAGSAATPVSFSSGTKNVFVAHEGKLSASAFTRLFGDGSDGDLSISAGTTAITQNMNYRNLSISGTGLLVTNGWKVRVQGTLDVSQATVTRAITNAGATGGAGAAGGTAGAVSALTGANTVGRAGAGGAGGAGGTAAGSNGTAASNLAVSNGGPGGLSGAGGAGSGGAGGAAAVGGSVSAFTRFSADEPLMRENAGVVSHIMGGAGGGGGGGGGGDGTAGGGGGAGGNGGGVIDLNCAVLKISSSTVAGVIESTGGFGGDGGTPAAGNRGGGGGGSGAGGGYIHLVAGTVIGSKSGALAAPGGGGGAGGAPSGTGVTGAGGAGGYGGTIHYFNLTAGTRTETIGSAGGAAAGAAGGAGGACSSGV